MSFHSCRCCSRQSRALLVFLFHSWVLLTQQLWDISLSTGQESDESLVKLTAIKMITNTNCQKKRTMLKSHLWCKEILKLGGGWMFLWIFWFKNWNLSSWSEKGVWWFFQLNLLWGEEIDWCIHNAIDIGDDLQGCCKLFEVHTRGLCFPVDQVNRPWYFPQNCWCPHEEKEYHNHHQHFDHLQQNCNCKGRIYFLSQLQVIFCKWPKMTLVIQPIVITFCIAGCIFLLLCEEQHSIVMQNCQAEVCPKAPKLSLFLVVLPIYTNLQSLLQRFGCFLVLSAKKITFSNKQKNLFQPWNVVYLSVGIKNTDTEWATYSDWLPCPTSCWFSLRLDRRTWMTLP